jgi:oxygen-dependent protoporphyrinogen oxidase
MLAEVDIPPRTESGDESLASFVERRFGIEALEVFGESLLAGIHVADPKALSIQATFPNYVQLEREHGSLIRGMKASTPTSPAPDTPKTAFVSPPQGMIQLIETLQARLTGDVRIGQAVARIGTDRTIHITNGDTFKADALIVTTPAQPASQTLSDAAPELSAALAQLKTVSSGTVSLGYRTDQLEHDLDGFGFVIPHSEPTRIRASTWSSTKLTGRAPEGYALIRVFFGGFGREQDVNLPDDQLIALARSDLKQIMGISTEPVISQIFRWRNASPQYEVGHIERIAHARTLTPEWLILAGCAYDGVGIPDCVRQGREAARQVVQRLQPEKHA